MRVQSALVTIGVPVYNGERYLEACIESLLAQTFRNFTIIISDNASTDRTPEIARAFCARDARVQYHRNAVNIGCPLNFVKAFELSRTPFFRWASADDMSEPEYLEQCLRVLEARPDVVQVYPLAKLIDADDNVLALHADNVGAEEERASERYVRVTRNTGMCNAIYGLMRSDALRRSRLLGPFIGSDVAFQAEISLYGKIVELPTPLLLRRMHGAAQSAMNDEQRARHYDPAGTEIRTASRWRHLFERAWSACRAPIPLADKARVLAFLGRGMIMRRDEFGREIRTHIRNWLTGSPPRVLR